MNNQTKYTCENSVVLYGISKVEYGANGCTPYPMCVKSCANYLGQDIGIDFAMVSTGAAFRLTWDTTSWNGGNVDVIHTYDDPEEVYRLGIEAFGREFQILARATNSCDVKLNSSTKSDNKDDFIHFIKTQIDRGLPCIALGIIGPPEACIITGYRECGETLLGWNFFQDGSEFASEVKIDESGYFITNKWWKNGGTVAVISMGEMVKPSIKTKSILTNAIKVMTGRLEKKSNKIFAKGIMAYDAWKEAILNESGFPPNAILPIMAERLMCHGDAMDCLVDGRNNAAIFMKKLSEELPEFKDLCKCAEEQFEKVASNIWKMADVLGGYARNEQQLRNFAKPEVGKQIALLIDECKAADSKALEALKSLKNSI
jgi:hypothetical protein